MLQNYKSLNRFQILIFSLATCVFVMAAVANPNLYRIFTTECYATANGVNFFGFSPKILLSLLLSYFLTGLLGYFLVKNFTSKVHLITQTLSGFFLGYLAVIAITRIVSIFLKSSAMYWVVCAAILIVIYIIKNHQLRNKKIINDTSLTKGIVIIFCSLFFLISVLGMQINAAEFSWVGHGPHQYAGLLNVWNLKTTRFPIILQHHDELLFHYWASFFVFDKINSILPWWVTLAFIKLSLFCFIYSAFRKLTVKSPLAFLFTLFLFFGTASPLFSKYFLLFDSSNPLFFTVHSGRIVGIGLIIWFICEFIGRPVNNESGISRLGLALICIGLTTTSISNAIWLLIFALLLRSLKKSSLIVNSELLKKLYYIVPVAIILGGIFYTPIYVEHINSMFVFLNLLLCFIFFFVSIKKLAGSHLQLSRDLTSLSQLKIQTIIFSILLGLFIFGNIPATFLHTKILNHFNHHLHVEALSQSMSNTSFNLKTFIGDHRELGIYNSYCWNIFYFYGYYGFYFIIFLGTIGLLSREFNKTHKITLKESSYFQFLTLIAILIPPLLFFMDFIDVGSRAWIKSRFLEIPLYSMLFLCGYFINKLSKKGEKIIIAFIILVYTLGPFILTERPKQISDNLKVIFSNDISHPDICELKKK